MLKFYFRPQTHSSVFCDTKIRKKHGKLKEFAGKWKRVIVHMRPFGTVHICDV